MPAALEVAVGLDFVAVPDSVIVFMHMQMVTARAVAKTKPARRNSRCLTQNALVADPHFLFLC